MKDMFYIIEWFVIITCIIGGISLVFYGLRRLVRHVIKGIERQEPMKAEEIAKHILYSPVTNGQYKLSIYEGRVMIEDFSEQQAKEFGEWLAKNWKPHTSPNGIYWTATYKSLEIEYNTDQIYKKWMEETQ